MNASIREARRHLRMLYLIAEMTELPFEDLTPLTGAEPRHVERWNRTGVPVARQTLVADILCTTLAPRRELSASVTQRLLFLRARHAAACEEDVRCIARLSHRRVSGHILVATRR